MLRYHHQLLLILLLILQKVWNCHGKVPAPPSPSSSSIASTSTSTTILTSSPSSSSITMLISTTDSTTTDPVTTSSFISFTTDLTQYVTTSSAQTVTTTADLQTTTTIMTTASPSSTSPLTQIPLTSSVSSNIIPTTSSTSTPSSTSFWSISSSVAPLTPTSSFSTSRQTTTATTTSTIYVKSIALTTFMSSSVITSTTTLSTTPQTTPQTTITSTCQPSSTSSLILVSSSSLLTQTTSATLTSTVLMTTISSSSEPTQSSAPVSVSTETTLIIITSTSDLSSTLTKFATSNAISTFTLLISSSIQSSSQKTTTESGDEVGKGASNWASSTFGSVLIGSLAAVGAILSAIIVAAYLVRRRRITNKTEAYKLDSFSPFKSQNQSAQNLIKANSTSNLLTASPSDSPYASRLDLSAKRGMKQGRFTSDSPIPNPNNLKKVIKIVNRAKWIFHVQLISKHNFTNTLERLDLRDSFWEKIKAMSNFVEGEAALVEVKDQPIELQRFALSQESIRVHILNRPEDISSQEFITCFRREVALFKELAERSNVLTQFAYSENPLALFSINYEMNLLEYMTEKRSLPIQLIETIMGQVCKGVKALHEYNLVHMHLVPESIKIVNLNKSDSAVVAKVSGFGLTGILSDSREKATMRHIHYYAPEILEFLDFGGLVKELKRAGDKSILLEERISRLFSISTDIYAYGMLAYFIISGAEFNCGADVREVRRNILSGMRPNFMGLIGADSELKRLCKVVYSCINVFGKRWNNIGQVLDITG